MQTARLGSKCSPLEHVCVPHIGLDCSAAEAQGVESSLLGQTQKLHSSLALALKVHWEHLFTSLGLLGITPSLTPITALP